MAGEAKITKKIIDEAATILKAVPEDKLDDVAAELGTEPGLVREFLKNPKSKQAKELIQKAEGSLQGLVDKVLGRAAPEAAEQAAEAAPRLALPPATTQETGLVPVAQPGRLQTVASKLGKAEAIDVDFDPVTGAPMSVVGKKEPLALPAAGKTSMPSGRPSLSAGMEEPQLQSFPTGVEPVIPKRKAAAVGAGLGLGLAGKMIFDKGFSGDEATPPVVKEAGVEDAQDVKTVVDTIPEAAITPEQKEALNKQVDNFTEAVQSFERRMAAEQDAAKKEKVLKEGRLEFMRALETIMHGMVSALGANAMLNRGSPFAIDFSKGPQTDWASEFDRLQKNYDSQLNGIRSRYGLALKEQEAKAAEARAQQREVRAEKELALKEKALEQRGQAQQAAQTQKAAGQAEKAAEKQLALKEKAFAELSGSIAALKEKSTPISAKQVTANATRLGIPPEEIKLLIDKTTGKGFFNFADENKVADILEKYRPGQAATEAAPVESEQERKERRRQELLRKARGE